MIKQKSQSLKYFETFPFRNMSKYNIIQTIRFKCLRLWMLKLEIKWISPKFPQNEPAVPQYSLDVITAPFQVLGAPHLSSKNRDPAQCYPDQCWGISPPPQHTWIGKYMLSRRRRELKNNSFAVQTIPYLLYCSSEDGLSIFLMVLPVLYNSDTCTDDI